MTRTHLQASLQQTDSGTQRADQINAAFSHAPDSICWTEVQQGNQVARIDAFAGYDTYWSLRNAQGQPVIHPRNYNPITWRTDTFRFVEGRAEFAYDGIGGQWPNAWFMRVVLEDLATGQHVARVSGHFVPGIESLHDETPAVREATIAASSRSYAVFIALLLEDGLPAIGSADTNDTQTIAKLRDRWPNHAFQIAQTGPTHPASGPRRRIDWVIGHNLHLLEAA